jgi:hypothetical protein
MQSSPLRASATISQLAPSARIKRGTADQSFGLDTLGLASVHTIYPRRRRSRLGAFVCGVAAAYILLVAAPASAPQAPAAPAIEAVR